MAFTPLSLHADPPKLGFLHVATDEDLAASFLYTLIEDRSGILWIGSMDGGGLYRFDGHSLSAYMTDFNNPKSISNNNVMALTPSQNGNIWVGTEKGGLNLFDPFTGEFDNYKHDPRNPGSLQHNEVTAILEDSKGEVWIASREGLSRFNPHSEEESFCNFTFMEGKGYKAAVSNYFRCLVEDQIDPNRIWVGTDAGLKSFDKRTQTFESIDNPFTEDATWREDGKARQFPVTDIIQPPSGHLWIATQGAGILRYNPRTGSWLQFRYEKALKKDELFLYNRIFDLEFAPPHTLWFGAEKKIGTFNTKSRTFSLLEHNPEDSTSIRNTGYYGLQIDTNGFLWGASYLGLSRSKHPILVSGDQHTPKVQVIGIRSRGKPIYAKNEIAYRDSLALDEEHRKFELSFTAINPPANQSLQYSYRLLPKEDWTQLDSLQPISYKLFWGGAYDFEVKARVKGEEWGPIQKLFIDVKKPFWQEGWFLFLSIAFLFSLGFAIFSFFKRVEKEREALRSAFNRELMEMKLSALRSQMNPHFLFNSLNSIKHFIIKNKPKAASRYLSKFSQLMRLILQNSQTALIPLSNELKALELYMELEQLRFEKKFTYTIAVDPSINQDEWEIPPMVLQPYVENAIWHGLLHKDSEGTIHIDLRSQAETLEISIEDNGIGRAKAKQLKSRSATKNKSYGMQITSERLKMIEVQHNIKTHIEIIDLMDETENPMGTRVELVMPFMVAKN
ncbi:MAG: histidine kinase [Bacteroidota bacterium]